MTLLTTYWKKLRTTFPENKSENGKHYQQEHWVKIKKILHAEFCENGNDSSDDYGNIFTVAAS